MSGTASQGRRAERHDARERQFNVKVPQPRGIGRVMSDESAVIMYFDRRLTDDEMRALHILGIGGFPTVALAPEEMRTPLDELLSV